MHGRNLNVTQTKRVTPLHTSEVQTATVIQDQNTKPSENLLKLRKFESSSGFDQSPYLLSPTYSLAGRKFVN